MTAYLAMRSAQQLRILSILGIVAVSVILLWKFPITFGLDIQGGSRLVFQAQSTAHVKVSDESMSGLIGKIRDRVDALGVAEPLIQQKGNDQVVVELPGVHDPERAVRVVGDTALLEFIEAEFAPSGLSNVSSARVAEVYGRGTKIISHEGATLVLKQTVLTGADLKGAWQDIDEYGRLAVKVEFTTAASKKFEEITARNIDRPIVIMLDNKIVSAPTVRTAIAGGVAQISGKFTPEEIKDFVAKLRAGALPVPVKLVEQRTVGPTLGRDSVDRSRLAGILGFVLILAFMVLYYRLPGFVSVIALCIYVLLVGACMGVLHVALTLPGMAGFLLSIGMAIDANIIIFERLKEELREKKPIEVGVEESFKRAFTAILDSNVTTIMGAGALFFVGTGSIRGFSVTLTIGILCSMFTAIVLTHQMMKIVVDEKIIPDSNSPLVYK